jgi:hypothetical protein
LYQADSLIVKGPGTEISDQKSEERSRTLLTSDF